MGQCIICDSIGLGSSSRRDRSVRTGSVRTGFDDDDNVVGSGFGGNGKLGTEGPTDDIGLLAAIAAGVVGAGALSVVSMTGMADISCRAWDLVVAESLPKARSNKAVHAGLLVEGA